VSGSRRYSMALRGEQTAATRSRIIDAATAQFVELGYPRTTLAGVAERAGVSVQTIYNLIGGKSVLLKTVYDVTIAGDDEPVPISERPYAKATMEATDGPECLRRYAAMARILGERVLPLYRVLLGQAAGGDPDLRAWVETIESERAVGSRAMIAHLAGRFGLREGLDPETAEDVLWTLNAPEVADRLVNRRGWSWERFEAWFAATLIDVLFGR
jgi:AcrR family transcriptional regulator